MNPEKLARLNAKSASLEGGHGGIPEITPSDIAAAMGMAKLSRLQAAILYEKYAGERNSGRIWAQTMLWIGDLYPNWLGDGLIQHVARYAIGRLLGDDRCTRCEGTGEDWNTAPPTVCASCRGNGVMSDEYRYSDPWQGRYRIILAMLEEAESEAIARIKI